MLQPCTIRPMPSLSSAPLRAMIISASRRTDIPAFYSPWLLNRLRAGEVLVRNPYNRRQVSRIRLDPAVVDSLVLWSKNPAPLLPYLHTLEALGYPLVIHYTLTGHDRHLEPGLPDLDERIATFCDLARSLGPERVLWRFDPILLTQTQGADEVLERFTMLAHHLQGYTHQCSISFVSLYAKCRRQLAGIDLRSVDNGEKQRLGMRLNSLARAYGIRLVACCDTLLTETCGIEPASCIDVVQLGALVGCTLLHAKDTGQRPGCGCSISIDIGAYDSCTHGCRYCYATTSARAVTRNVAAHDPNSPLLIGHLHGDETIRQREMVSLRRQQISLFAQPPAAGERVPPKR